MTIALSKGQGVDIGLAQLSVGLGWEPNSNASSRAFDLDACAFLLGADGQIPVQEFFVFYGNASSPDGAVKASGDDRTGGNSGGDNEVITVDLTKLDPRIEQIIFTVTIYEFDVRKQNFGQVR